MDLVSRPSRRRYFTSGAGEQIIDGSRGVFYFGSQLRSRACYLALFLASYSQRSRQHKELRSKRKAPTQPRPVNYDDPRDITWAPDLEDEEEPVARKRLRRPPCRLGTVLEDGYHPTRQRTVVPERRKAYPNRRE